MAQQIPPLAEIRRPLHYIAFWQAMSFVLLICAMWACEALGLLHDGPPDFERIALPTVVLALGAFIAVAHTFLQERHVLHGLITICSYCHKIRIDDNAWTRVEQFVCQHSHANFSHGVCPDCYRKLAADLTRAEAEERAAGTGAERKET